MSKRPDMRCSHMWENPSQPSMYYSTDTAEPYEYCLPCIVEIYERTHDQSLMAGVLMERLKGSGRVLTRRTA